MTGAPMRIVALAGMLLVLAGCTWSNAVSAVGSTILWAAPSGGPDQPQSEPSKLVCRPAGETVVDPTTECHAE
jgi:hypothetical protein